MVRRNPREESAADAGGGRFAILRPVGWLALAGGLFFVAASLAGFHPADWPSHATSVHLEPPANWCGRFGAIVAFWTYHLFGHGAWLGLALILAYLVATARGRHVSHPFVRALGGLTMVLAFSGLQRLLAPAGGPFPEGGGGLLAIVGVEALFLRFNALGTFLILLTFLGIGAVIALDQIVIGLPAAALRAVGLLRKVPVGSAISAIRTATAAIGDRLPQTAPSAASTSSIPVRIASRRRRGEAADSIDPDAGGFAGTQSFEPDDEPETPDDDDLEAASTAKVRRGEIDIDALREKIRKLPVNFSQKKPARSATEHGLPGRSDPANGLEAHAPDSPDYSGYQFPSLDLLIEPEETFTEKMEQFVREQAEVLEHALKVYGIEGEVVGIDSGPVITLYEVQLTPGTKVAAITSIASDIARALRAQNIRVVPNMAGKSTIGVEVPNLTKEKVRIKELMTAGGTGVGPVHGRDPRATMHLPMFLGKDASGTPLIADLTAMPHMLVAGTTGSGKSVCINTIITSFLYTKRPDELKLILVDPKMVEMSQFRDIPHLMCPVVTEMGRATAILEWAVTKMEERYELLAEVGVRDVAAYNTLEWDDLKDRLGPMSEKEEATIPKRLPYIVFIIDELADLIMTNKEVETHIVRVAQKARAVGIHLILATQRPQANVVTGLIKSNMPCRVSFKVSSGMDSRIVLDQKGAELLLGQGDMLFLGPRSSELIRAQGTLVDDAEIRRVTRFLKDVAAPSYERQLMTLRSSAASLAPGSAGGSAGDDEEGLDEAERDPLFFDAVDIIVETGRGSVSLLQRRLAIGYTRASRLIDQMGQAGIIGEHKGSVAREVIISPEEWQQMRRMMEEGEAQNTLFAESGLDDEDEDDDDPYSRQDDDDPDEGDDDDFEDDDADEDEVEEDEEEEGDEEEDEEAPFDSTRRTN